jgi:hypothetical protein
VRVEHVGIVPIGSLHTGWALKVDGIVRRSSENMIPLLLFIGGTRQDHTHLAQPPHAITSVTSSWQRWRTGVDAPSSPRDARITPHSIG